MATVGTGKRTEPLAALEFTEVLGPFTRSRLVVPHHP